MHPMTKTDSVPILARNTGLGPRDRPDIPAVNCGQFTVQQLELQPRSDSDSNNSAHHVWDCMWSKQGIAAAVPARVAH